MFKRVISAAVALAMLLGMVIAMPAAKAAEDTAEYIDMIGVYTVTSVLNGKVLSVDNSGNYQDNSADFRLEDAHGGNNQRLVFQRDDNLYAYTTTGNGAGYKDTIVYGIRAVDSKFWMHGNADGTVQQRDNDTNPDNTPNYKHKEGRWDFFDAGDGYYYIVFTADHFSATNAGENNINETANDMYLCAVGGTVKLTAKPETLTAAYKWKLERTHLPESTLRVGTYYLESQSTASTDANNVVLSAAAIGGDGNMIITDMNHGTDANKYANSWTHFVIQPISGGAYSVVCGANGKYLKTTDSGVAVGQSSDKVPTAEERWYVVPASKDGNTGTSAARFRLISAVSGYALAVNGSAVTMEDYANAATQSWYIKDIRSTAVNAEKGQTQTTNSGVFADTFNINDTVSLPIKIFDYAADGMLFEYASNTTDHKFDYTLDDPFRMGNNLSFSMVSRSDGGTLTVEEAASGMQGKDWTPGNYPSNWPGYDSNSFDYNKYWSPYVSGIRINANGTTDPQILTGSQMYSFSTDPDGDGIHAQNSAVLVSAGTMNTATAGVDYGKSAAANAILQDVLGFPMFSKQTFGNATMGLLESGLVEVELGGKTYTLPRYRQHTVEFIAMALQRTLEINKVGDGINNYNYVDGETTFADLASGLDLAALLRGDTAADVGATGILEYEDGTTLSTRFTKYGSYAETMAKADKLIGSWADVKDNIKTCMDAAYWMLNSLFLENSFNQPQNRYNALVLTKVTDQYGKEGYIFDSTFVNSAASDPNVANSAVKYDSVTGTIRNTSAAGKSFTYWKLDSSAATYSFTPVRTADGDASNPRGTQTGTQTPYVLDGGYLKSDYGRDETEYHNQNFNFVLQSNGKFVYHEEDRLFFEFEGDDDVYLFINGQIVLDIGGAHAVTGTAVDINDYTDWAWNIKHDEAAYAALTDAQKARVDALAIHEGDECSFDFYYMERHGYGSNMRIFTNIRVSSTDVQVEKSAYQDDTQISYDAVVDGKKMVEYGFTMTNSSNVNLYALSLSDKDIGVYIGFDKGLEVSNTAQVTDRNGQTLDAEDLAVTLIKADGTRIPIDLTLGSKGANTALRRLLSDVPYAGTANGGNTNGLPAGWSLEFRGIYYTLTKQQIDDGRFLNTVRGDAWTGIVMDENDTDENGDPYDDLPTDPNNPGYIDPDRFRPSGTTVYDEDDMRIRTPSAPRYYQWKDHTVTVSMARLVKDIVESVDAEGKPMYEGITNDNVSAIRLTTAVGTPTSYAGVRLDGDSNLHFTFDSAGAKIINVKLTYHVDGSDLNMVVPVLIFVTEVSDKIFVLDYGLGVDLTEHEALFANDTLTVPGRDTTSHIFGVTAEKPSYLTYEDDLEAMNNIRFNLSAESEIPKTYGTYTYDGGSLRYDPTQFMEGADTIWAAIRVSEQMNTEQALGAVDENIEVEMYKSITVIPANVVYYEDNFSSIGYTDSAVKNSIEILGSLEGTNVNPDQSADQDMNYGFDDGAYNADQNVQLSHGTCTKITITGPKLAEKPTRPMQPSAVASFTFNGTGFELIGRTNAKDSATIMLQIVSEDGTFKKNIPVITEFDHGADGGDEEIYQVPVIRLEGLNPGKYTVTVYGMPAMDYSYDWTQAPDADGLHDPWKTTYLYVDGVRIYNPLNGTADSGYTDNYGDEKDASFTELRNLVLQGMAAAVSYAESDGSLDVTYSNVVITEDRNLNDKYTSTKGGMEQFNIVGPNNELYMDSKVDDASYAIALYIKEEGDGPHLLQLGIHDIDEIAFYGKQSEGGVNTTSAIRIHVAQGWTDWVTVQSGTEQYFTIDYTKCPVTEDGYYEVLLQVDGFVSFTNVKHNGLTFKTIVALDPQTVITYNDQSVAITDGNGNLISHVDPADLLDLQDLTNTMGSNAKSNLCAIGLKASVMVVNVEQEG